VDESNAEEVNEVIALGWFLGVVLLSVYVGVRERFDSPTYRGLRALLEAVALAAGVFYIFRPLFSQDQADGLAAIFGFVAFCILILLDRTDVDAHFMPCWIRIEPNWYQLLSDHGSVDESKWKELQIRYAEKSPAGYDVLLKGISFTALSPTLYYSDDFHYFFGKLDLRAEIEELRPAEKPPWPFSDFAPKFYVKEIFDLAKRRRYLEFGLITLESIQRERKHDFDDAPMFVTVARLPKEFFGAIHGPELSSKKLAALEKKLEQSGWNREKRDWEDHHFGIPAELQHKYVRIRYGEISER
jgi:hypothetical protein